jgi:hypothetical protein
MMKETWGILSEPPHTVQVYRHHRLVRAYRRHRSEITDRNHIAFFEKLAAEIRAEEHAPKPQKKFVRDAKGRFASVR